LSQNARDGGRTSFEPEGYLKFDLREGRLETRDAPARHLVVPVEVLEAAASARSLSRAARKWGEQVGGQLSELVGPGAVLDQPPETLVTELRLLLGTFGWGRCELESWGGVLFVIAHGPPGGAGRSILAELLAGVFTVLAGAPFESVVMSDVQPTRFLLLGPDGVKRVRRWVGQGNGTGAIVQRMLAGEHLEPSA